jgi:hypothetical protein
VTSRYPPHREQAITIAESDYSENIPAHEAGKRSRPRSTPSLLSTPTTVSAAYIESPHASGTSVTLVPHVARLFKENSPETKATYLLPLAAEANMLRKAQNVREAIDANALELLDHSRFLETFNARDITTKRIILLDNEINLAADGVLVFRRLMEWTSILQFQKDRCAGNAIVVLSPFYCEPTLSALQKKFGPDACSIEVTDRHTVLLVTQILAQHLRQYLRELADRARQGQRAIACTGEEGVEFARGSFANTVEQAEHIEKAVREAPLFLVSPSAPSTPCDGLEHIVISEDHPVHVFDRVTSQIVKTTRPIAWSEIDGLFAWALKTGDPFKVQITCAFDVDDDGIEEGVEFRKTHAYSRDILWTAIKCIKWWPGARFLDMPGRWVRDRFAIEETCHRLRLAGCVQETEKGLGHYILTSQGVRMLEIRKAFPSLDFHAAHLLGNLGDPAMTSSNVKRVIIRLAAVTTVGPSNMMVRNRDRGERTPSMDELLEYTAGIGAQQVPRGTLWVALGLWQKTRTDAAWEPPASGALLIDGDRVAEVAAWVEAFERLCGLPPPTDELRDTRLEDSLVRQVEERLMWAWIFRMAFYKSGRLPWDLASQADLRQDPSDAFSFYDLMPEEKVSAGVFAIYSELGRTRDNAYTVHGPTYMPAWRLNGVTDKFGEHVADLVQTSYPYVN